MGIGSPGYAYDPENVGRSWWGNYADGDVSIGANTTLTGHKNYRNLTIDSGFTLTPSAYVPFVYQRAIVNGTVSGVGNAGNSNGTAGTAGAVGQFGGGAAGGAGGNPGAGANGSNRTVAQGAAGGNGGAGAGGAGGTGGTVTGPPSADGNPHFALAALTGTLVVPTIVETYGGAGGAGGGGDGAAAQGAGGGAGGKPLYLPWFDVINNGVITADGGAGAAGQAVGCGGSGGGGAGYVGIVCRHYGGTVPSVAGGALGAGGGGAGVAGVAGSNGSYDLLYL